MTFSGRAGVGVAVTVIIEEDMWQSIRTLVDSKLGIDLYRGSASWNSIGVPSSKIMTIGYNGYVLRLEGCPKDDMIGGNKIGRVLVGWEKKNDK
ncbi:hypothetical protein BHE74_00033109, partial [Ensete ventricosum]